MSKAPPRRKRDTKTSDDTASFDFTKPSPEVVPSELRRVGVFGKAWREFKDTLREASRWKELRKTPYGLLPILLFSGAGIIGGFDGAVFGLVVPNIVQDLNLDIVRLLSVLNIVGFLFLGVSVVLSYGLDRWRRVPFVAGGTILTGLTSLFTPHARNNYTLGISQIGSGLGGEAAGTPGFSLITDYYPHETRGRVFAMSGTLQRIGGLFAPYLISLLVAAHGWRVPFSITGTGLVVMGVLMLFLLKEPVRGYMERRALGLSEKEALTPEPAPSIGEAWRTIWGIRTLRRLFIGSIVGGIGDRIYGFIFGLMLFQTFHLDVIERGKIFTIGGIAGIVGGFLGGGLVSTLLARRPERVLLFTGALGALEAFALAGVAATPPIWVVVVVFSIFGLAFSLIGPARSVVFTSIIPANMRTLGLALPAVLSTIPAAIVFQAVLGQLPKWGYPGLLLASSPFFLVSALIDMSAAGLLPGDLRNAFASQKATAEYKAAKEAGGLKLLVAREIGVDYDGVQVLFGVDFDCEVGEIVALLGTNGAGKSTLLKAISGVHGASDGAIVYDGRDITHLPANEVAQRGIVHMPGGKGIFPGLTVRENLDLATWTHQEYDEDSPFDPGPLKDFTLEDVLGIFPQLRDLMDRPAGALSGGEQQMVSLGQALLQRPRLLLIDELSLGLSPAVVQVLVDAVKKINKLGVTIVVVEQSVNVALTIAERAIFMEKGEVKFSGKTKDLLARPDILRAVYVKGTGALTSQPGGARAARRTSMEDRRVVLSVQGLKKSFGGVVAVDGATFDLHDEEILGLIGPNGAGKTTIFDMISGYLAPDEGSVIYEGADVTNMPPDQRARMQLIRRFQDARLFPALTVYETILVALDRKHEVRNLALTALQLPNVRASERRARRRADQLIDLLGIGAYRDKFVKELSTGLRRVTDLACVLATEPRVLLLDEPSSGIAQAEAESLGPLLLRVRRETGCSILIIEHDMPLIARVADELVALEQGRVLTRGAPDTVLNDPRVIESYLGTSEEVIRRSGARK